MSHLHVIVEFFLSNSDETVTQVTQPERYQTSTIKGCDDRKCMMNMLSQLRKFIYKEIMHEFNRLFISIAPKSNCY